jgi:hypothetical protein
MCVAGILPARAEGILPSVCFFCCFFFCSFFFFFFFFFFFCCCFRNPLGALKCPSLLLS